MIGPAIFRVNGEEPDALAGTSSSSAIRRYCATPGQRPTARRSSWSEDTPGWLTLHRAGNHRSGDRPEGLPTTPSAAVVWRRAEPNCQCAQSGPRRQCQGRIRLGPAYASGRFWTLPSATSASRSICRTIASRIGQSASGTPACAPPTTSRLRCSAPGGVQSGPS